MTLRELAAGAEGEALAAQLISVLITSHLSSPTAITDELSAQLEGGAPAFFKVRSRYQASCTQLDSCHAVVSSCPLLLVCQVSARFFAYSCLCVIK